MAGHYPLSKFDEPKVFELVEEIKRRVVSIHNFRKDFTKFRITAPTHSLVSGKYFECMKLSDDYAEYSEELSGEKANAAYSIGKFSLESITDEHPSVTQNISLEVHFNINGDEVKIVNIFWVA